MLEWQEKMDSKFKADAGFYAIRILELLLFSRPQ
jgi:hypothetical protein